MKKPSFCDTCMNFKTDHCNICISSTDPNDIPSEYKQETIEMVDHPKHYKNGKFECIDVMVEIFGIEATQHFCLLNAFKYNWRCKQKGNTMEDVKKANWYLEKYEELENMKNGKS